MPVNDVTTTSLPLRQTQTTSGTRPNVSIQRPSSPQTAQTLSLTFPMNINKLGNDPFVQSLPPEEQSKARKSGSSFHNAHIKAKIACNISVTKSKLESAPQTLLFYNHLHRILQKDHPKETSLISQLGDFVLKLGGHYNISEELELTKHGIHSSEDEIFKGKNSPPSDKNRQEYNQVFAEVQKQTGRKYLASSQETINFYQSIHDKLPATNSLKRQVADYIQAVEYVKENMQDIPHQKELDSAIKLYKEKHNFPKDLPLSQLLIQVSHNVHNRWYKEGTPLDKLELENRMADDIPTANSITTPHRNPQLEMHKALGVIIHNYGSDNLKQWQRSTLTPIFHFRFYSNHLAQDDKQSFEHAVKQVYPQANSVIHALSECHKGSFLELMKEAAPHLSDDHPLKYGKNVLANGGVQENPNIYTDRKTRTIAINYMQKNLSPKKVKDLTDMAQAAYGNLSRKTMQTAFGVSDAQGDITLLSAPMAMFARNKLFAVPAANALFPFMQTNAEIITAGYFLHTQKPLSGLSADDQLQNPRPRTEEYLGTVGQLNLLAKQTFPQYHRDTMAETFMEFAKDHGFEVSLETANKDAVKTLEPYFVKFLNNFEKDALPKGMMEEAVEKWKAQDFTREASGITDNYLPKLTESERSLLQKAYFPDNPNPTDKEIKATIASALKQEAQEKPYALDTDVLLINLLSKQNALLQRDNAYGSLIHGLLNNAPDAKQAKKQKIAMINLLGRTPQVTMSDADIRFEPEEIKALIDISQDKKDYNNQKMSDALFCALSLREKGALTLETLPYLSKKSAYKIQEFAKHLEEGLIKPSPDIEKMLADSDKITHDLNNILDYNGQDAMHWGDTRQAEHQDAESYKTNLRERNKE